MPTGRPDWFGTIVAAGKYDTTFIPIGLDESGAILALMKGAYGSFLKTIAVDENSVMKANLSVQDLDFLTVRPAYGKSIRATNTIACDAEDTTILKTIEGRGVIIAGFFRWSHTASAKDLYCVLKIDDTVLDGESPLTLVNFEGYNPGFMPMYLVEYDEYDCHYNVAISPLLTFETSVEISVINPYAFGLSVLYYIFYALVP